MTREGAASAGGAQRSRFGRALVALGAAHLVAYPVAAVWMFAVVPVLMPLFDAEMQAAGSGEAELVGVAMPAPVLVIVRRAIAVGIASFALTHVAALPWMLAPTPAGRRRFVVAVGALSALGAAIGLVGWGWLVFVAKG